MIRSLLALGAILSLSSCATVMNDSTHPMRVDTVTEDGRMITGAECVLSNDKSHTRIRSGESGQVRRSARDLEISCTHPGYPDGIGRATSRANAGMWGNLILGGAVGAVVDHSKGTAYTYPTWVQVVFGWVTSFDRRHEEDGQPVTGTRVTRTTVGPAPTVEEAVPPPSPPPAAPSAEPTDAATAVPFEAKAGDVLYVAAASARLFDNPDGAASGALPRGAEVQVHSRRNAWLLVTAGSQAGWVSLHDTCAGDGCALP